jgi:hypothetical protein
MPQESILREAALPDNARTSLVQRRIEVRAFGAEKHSRPSPIFIFMHQVIEKQVISPSGTFCARRAGQFP